MRRTNICGKCGSSRRYYKRDGTSCCKDCRNSKSTERRKANPDYFREYYKKNSGKYKNQYKSRILLKKYGISLKQRNDLETKQAGLCAICNKNKKLYIDHCHSSGRIRGLLCNECNMALGLFNDNKEAISKAIEYLESFSYLGHKVKDRAVQQYLFEPILSRMEFI